MATLEKQYNNYLDENPDSTFTFSRWKEWHGNQIKKELTNIMKADEELGLYDEPKQETLEEAAERMFPYKMEEYDIFLIGAKWQQNKICNSEVLQRIRASKSDAEARRIIRNI